MGGLVGVEEGVESLGEEERRRGGWDGHDGDGRGIFRWPLVFVNFLVLGAFGDVSGSKSKESRARRGWGERRS